MGTMRTIKSNEDIDRLFKQGKHRSSAFLAVRIAPTPEPYGKQGRVAFIAGKKLGNAVVRNRCKRIMRVMVQDIGGPWKGYDVALIARSNNLASAKREAIARTGRELTRNFGE